MGIWGSISTWFASHAGGYIASLLAALTGFFAHYIYANIAGLSGHLSGRWYGVVFDERGNIVKYDLYLAFHYGEKLYVKGQRIFPSEQTQRKWDFVGVYRDRLVSGFFKSLDPKVNSVGCVLLKHDHTGEDFSGFYMTLYERTTGKGKFTERIGQTQYKWSRQFDELFSQQNQIEEPSKWRLLKLFFLK